MYFIVNQVAGNSKPRIVQTILKYFPEADISLTEYPGHALSLSQKAQKRGEKTIVVCGGDGTIHEVVNGLNLPDPNLTVGVIPTGTGNALAIRLNIPLNIDKALKALSKKAKVMSMDIGLIDSEKFVNFFSIGLDAEINKTALRRKPEFPGFPIFAYVPAIAKEMLNKHCWLKISLYLDEKLVYQGKAAIVSVNNSPYYGIGLPINPSAQIDDGKLNLCLVKEIKELEIPLCISEIALRKHQKNRNKFLLKEFTSARVSSEEPVLLQIDGETIGLINEFDVSILQRAVNVLYIP